MLQKVALGTGLAHAAKLHSLNWQHSSPLAKTALMIKQPVTEECYPGLSQTFNTKEEALASYTGSGLYEDESFFGKPALFNNVQTSEYDEIDTYQWIKDKHWKRPSEIDEVGADFSFWGPYGIGPQGVSQGSLGDCWFLAAVAGIAEHGSRIESIFAGQGKQDNGMYVLKFYVLGEPVYITVDDRLPTFKNGDLVNAWYSDAGAWWMPILEKAYAKFNQNYASLSAGSGYTAFRDLTGMPADQYELFDYDEDEVWDLIESHDEKDHIMTCVCTEEIDGLVSGHLYTILGVDEETESIVLRNPWASEQYHGEGGDQLNDGKFNLPLKTFKQTMPYVSVAHYKDWKVTSPGIQTFADGGDQVSWNLDVKESQEVIITLDLVEWRKKFDDCDENFKVKFKVFSGKCSQFSKKKCKDADTGKWNKPIEKYTCDPWDNNVCNAEFENLEAGWYTYYVDSQTWMTPPTGTIYGVHVYSADSPVHMYRDEEKVSTEQESSYVPDGGMIGDEGVVLKDMDDFESDLADLHAEWYGEEGGVTCTAAGCVQS